jgi:hypothetical protein
MSILVRTSLALIALSMALPCAALAQAPAANKPAAPANAAGKAELMVRVYQVADLVTSPPDYPYRGTEIPTTSQSLGSSGYGGISLGGGGYGGGGLGGGGGGFGGGGFFQVSDTGGGGFGGEGQIVQGGLGGFAAPEPGATSRKRFTIDDLINAIQSTIEPQSWVDVGGNAVCTPLGGLLIVKQTAAAHEQIENLLRAIQAEAGLMQTLTVQAHWLLLTRDQLAQLQAANAPDQGRPANVVDRAALDELARTAALYEGQITCFSEQAVHLVSGDRRLVVTGAIPVVSAATAGYQPVLSAPNIGVLLELKPTLLAHGQAALLDLESTVTALADDEAGPIPVRVDQSPASGAMPSSGVKVDRLNLETQHLATTVGVPVGQPVLVGGLSVAGGVREPAADPAGARQLYLVVEVRVNEGPR